MPLRSSTRRRTPRGTAGQMMASGAAQGGRVHRPVSADTSARGAAARQGRMRGAPVENGRAGTLSVNADERHLAAGGESGEESRRAAGGRVSRPGGAPGAARRTAAADVVSEATRASRPGVRASTPHWSDPLRRGAAGSEGAPAGRHGSRKFASAPKSSVDAKRSRTVRGLSVDSPRTVGGRSANCRWTVRELSVDGPRTVGGRSADCRWTAPRTPKASRAYRPNGSRSLHSWHSHCQTTRVSVDRRPARSSCAGGPTLAVGRRESRPAARLRRARIPAFIRITSQFHAPLPDDVVTISS
ncbi:uncharacterized protein SOCE26_063880 [Sorangium cellulosum]|uniref:Uncharacterized protein n=1 Tax=Sorangium cellulosum TaxID=56 RepID=A0A2L0F030_SORCE|nr:uncharacterized protein SOCE26_063880 [Sorangium cellulosum]